MYGSSIFQLWPDKCIVCHLFHGEVFVFNNSTDKIKCFGGFFR